jgi:hypothetical protein
MEQHLIQLADQADVTRKPAELVVDLVFVVNDPLLRGSINGYYGMKVFLLEIDGAEWNEYRTRRRESCCGGLVCA